MIVFIFAPIPFIFRSKLDGFTTGHGPVLKCTIGMKLGFNPGLQVKKLEDKDFEPLAQFIQRIGDSERPLLGSFQRISLQLSSTLIENSNFIYKEPNFWRCIRM